MADWRCRGINYCTIALDPLLTRVQGKMPQLPQPGRRGDSGMCCMLSPSVPQRGPAPVVHRDIWLDDTPFIDPFPSLCHIPTALLGVLGSPPNKPLALRPSSQDQHAYGGTQTKIQTMVIVLDRIMFPPWCPHPNPQNL